jgi:fructose-1,6-bisphosphatase/inositol monophosphatase family enzyme
MSGPQLDQIDRIIRDVAAAEIMPRFQKLLEGDVQMKGVNDPVTIADQEAEKQLSERLMAALPGSVVVGEEGFAADKSIMSRVDAAEPVWIIDPIDGTRNFVAGNPEFGVMVALVKNRQPVASWIHHPSSGDTLMAEQGSGVYLRGKRVKLATSDANLPPLGLVGARAKKLVSDPSIIPAGNELPPIEIGSCAAFDYSRLFISDVNFGNLQKPRASFLFYRQTNPWDHVPGLLLHREGGGYSAAWNGQPYDMSNHRGGLIYAKDKPTWGHLHQLFEPVMQHALKKAS